MNFNKLRALILIGAIVFISSLDMNAQSPRGGKKPPTPEKIIKKLDTDKDGKISKSEAEADERGKLKENFDVIDTDKDTYISEEELKVFIDERRKERRR